jgi:hypothetical protein
MKTPHTVVQSPYKLLHTAARVYEDPTKTTTVHDSTAPSNTVMENCNRPISSRVFTASCLHMRKLCPATLQRLQRFWGGCTRAFLCLLLIDVRIELL